MWHVSAGSGQSVVFVHGAFCDYRFWESQFESVSGRYRATAVSLSGYHPENFEAVPTFTAELHVNELGEFLAKQGIKVHLIGHSRGGRIVLEVAARFPNLLQSLVLLEPGGAMEPGFLEMADRADETPPVPAIILGEAASLVGAGEVERGMRLYIDAGHGAGAWDNQTPEFHRIATSNARTIFAMMQDQTVPFRKDAAVAVQCPTLLLLGDASPGIFTKIIRRLKTLISQSDYVLLKEADHFFPNKQQKLVNRTLLNWLDEHSLKT